MSILLNKQLDFSLYLVTNRILCGRRSLENVIELAVQGGVTAVQLREKTASIREILKLGEKLKKILQPYNVPLIINDRIDIVMALDAEGVHLGQEDFSYQKAREILGNKKIIGLSVTTLEEAEQAEKYDVAYLGVGPVFFTPTKSDANKPLGLEQLRMIKKISRHPLVAIGGINIKNIVDVMAIGIDGVAVVSAICSAENPKQAANELLQALSCPY